MLFEINMNWSKFEHSNYYSCLCSTIWNSKSIDKWKYDKFIFTLNVIFDGINHITTTISWSEIHEWNLDLLELSY